LKDPSGVTERPFFIDWGRWHLLSKMEHTVGLGEEKIRLIEYIYGRAFLGPSKPGVWGHPGTPEGAR